MGRLVVYWSNFVDAEDECIEMIFVEGIPGFKGPISVG